MIEPQSLGATVATAADGSANELSPDLDLERNSELAHRGFDGCLRDPAVGKEFPEDVQASPALCVLS